MLEEMAAFFNRRVEQYEAHQLTCIEDAAVFYPFTARCLPLAQGARVLDLGCGTGLELDEYFALNPSAHVTGIDLAHDMLAVLREKFPPERVTLIEGSYFTVPLGEACFDAAVSVESLHHFPAQEKAALYAKVRRALKKGGYLIVTDYFARSQQEEDAFRQELLRLTQGAPRGACYHFDTPLTVQNETQALHSAGFSSVTLLGQWGATHTLRAEG